MEDKFRIYIDRLREGNKQIINESFPPEEALDVNEDFLTFSGPVTVNGEAYIASDMLILHLNVRATAVIPCTICNESVDVPIQLDGLYQAEPLHDIRGGIFNYREIIREAILLETPPFVECNEGKCSKRQEIDKFFKKNNDKNGHSEDTYHPFADL